MLVDGGSTVSASLPETAGPCACAGRGALAEPVGDIPNGIFLSIPPKLPAPRLGLLVSASEEEEEEEGRGGGAGGSPLIDWGPALFCIEGMPGTAIIVARIGCVLIPFALALVSGEADGVACDGPVSGVLEGDEVDEEARWGEDSSVACLGIGDREEARCGCCAVAPSSGDPPVAVATLLSPTTPLVLVMASCTCTSATSSDGCVVDWRLDGDAEVEAGDATVAVTVADGAWVLSCFLCTAMAAGTGVVIEGTFAFQLWLRPSTLVGREEALDEGRDEGLDEARSFVARCSL